jgi:Fe2+ or Zn2+ uptake regulation protein
MIIYTLTPIGEAILQQLAQNGGSYSGTTRLVDQIPASPDGVYKALRHCRHTGLIRSLHTHGGRGNLALHKLTRKGRRHVQPK